MNNNIKKAVALIMSFSMLFSLTLGLNANATDDFWSKLSRPYYKYEVARFNDAQKALYDKIYNTLYQYIEGGDDFKKDGELGYVTEDIDCGTLTESDIISVVMMIQIEHPEIYYINQYAYFGDNDDGKTCLSLGVYDDFATGSSRKEASGKLKSEIEKYISAAQKGETDFDKEKIIHDMICQNATYVDNAEYSQSTASILLNGKGICAGYAKTFALMCNILGMPTVSITSDTHQWNEILLDGRWYGVDVTWDDDNDNMSYRFFNKSDAILQSNDSVENHIPSALWSVVGREECLYNYGVQNVISIDEAAATALVRDDVTSADISVPLEYVTEGTLYHLSSPDGSQYMYTKNTIEAFVLTMSGWIHDPKYDYIAISGLDDEAIPLYRLYNPDNGGKRLYTTSAGEVNNFMKQGYNYEGIMCYVYSKGSKQGRPVYRMLYKTTGQESRSYIVDEKEKNILYALNWTNEGIFFRVK